MSVNCTVWAWAQNIPVSGEKLVLLSLADWANREGVCWPGQMLLAQMCNFGGKNGDRAVRTHLAALAEKGLLSKSKRVMREGHQPVNVYQLHIENWDNVTPELQSRFPLDRTHSTGGTDRTHRPGETGPTGPAIRKEPLEKKTPQKKRGTRKNAANTIAKKWASVKDLPGYVAILRQLPIVEKAPVPVEWFEEVRAGAEEKAGGADLEVGLTDVAEKFRDWYSTPGQRNLKVWKTAWRRWVEESYAKAAEFSVSGQVHDPFDPNCPCQMCVKSRGESETTQSTEEVDGSEVEGGRQVETGRRVQAAAKQPGATAAEPAGEDQQGAREKAEGVPGVPAKVPG